ncbi:MAG: hypothetical protein IID45_05425, partial [Planctomycetes bacterium]|nr:hypothetical protein [Planctomycetota bacterium]
MSIRQSQFLWGGLFCTVTAVCVGAGFYFVDQPAVEQEAKQEERPTPDVKTLLPGNAVIYFGWDGQDAHQQAFEKTAAYEALYKTGLVDLFKKVITYAGGKIGGGTNKYAVSLLKNLFRVVNGKGLSFAVSVSTDGAGPPKPQMILVLHEAAGLQSALSQAIKEAAVTELKFTTKKISGRSVTRASIPADGAPFELEIGWWSEGKHLVIVGGVDAVDNALAVARGKSPNITTNPLWKKYKVAKADFEVTSVGWFDLGALRKMLGGMPVPIPGAKPGLTVNTILKTLGLQNIGAIVGRSGYDGRALRSETTLEAPGQKTGLLALAAQKPNSLDELPPLPQSTNGFAA